MEQENAREQVDKQMRVEELVNPIVPSHSNSLMKWLVGGNIVLSLSSLACAGYLYFNQPKVVTFDLKNTTKLFLEQISKLDVSEEKKQQIVTKYEKALNGVVADYQAQNMIVLVKNAVVSPVEDRTSEIQREISKRMQEK
ncbi:TrbI F-type domain-containing protein [Glaesserella parasuis]|uniref:TrbI F-type domain-containing protein n=1 Tax=Glaesserella parasuis TaxID=738 RepID=UPI000950283E|nr:TrbI F-type domain-containing protein [Glaesserella parasuis]MCT8760483.1 type-F conjugative transfer system protein TrbI [Glaesserella parasuis]MCT8766579.1 type-F conjugative transfer system protein TrbI [Glaesserella parasuis]MDG6261611.1 TrbI F-type domain-containing protein [Glaesserella parasuis]MDG6280375.1 TrbI F-type domain-containing protein [Glaesserella parasuis]MDG6307833.1 TrbI F-type domain-containing protein [Glaesserella parasuis]